MAPREEQIGDWHLSVWVEHEPIQRVVAEAVLRKRVQSGTIPDTLNQVAHQTGIAREHLFQRFGIEV